MKRTKSTATDRPSRRKTSRVKQRVWRQVTTPQAPVNQQMREQLSMLDRIALWVTDRVGTFGFFTGVQVAYFGWILLDLILPPTLRYDPVPAYPVLLFVSNYIQLSLMPMIMIGQNLQGRHAELRAEADYALTQRIMAFLDAWDATDRTEELFALLQQTREEVARLRADVQALQASLHPAS